MHNQFAVSQSLQYANGSPALKIVGETWPGEEAGTQRRYSHLVPVPILPMDVELEPSPQSLRPYFYLNRTTSAEFIMNLDECTRWLACHFYRHGVRICVDGRVADFLKGLQLLEGLGEAYCSAGGKSDFGSYSNCQRTRDSLRKTTHIRIGDVNKRMVEMRWQTVHYSRSMPDTASCAALKHDTKKGIRLQQKAVRDLNHLFEGSMVAFVATIETDLDAVTVIGPDGDSLSVLDMYENQSYEGESGKERIIFELKKIFPEHWKPLRIQSQEYRLAFYPELAERLQANIEFVRHVQDSGRPIELLDHQERMIFVGRHALIPSHNSVFLIDDTETDLIVQNAFQIALYYVAKNILTDAVRSSNRFPEIPVLINVPHDVDDSRLMRKYVQALRRKLERKLTRCAAQVAEKLRSDPSGLIHTLESMVKRKEISEIPDWLDLCLKAFESMVKFCTSISDRRTRLFVPFT